MPTTADSGPTPETPGRRHRQDGQAANVGDNEALADEKTPLQTHPMYGHTPTQSTPFAFQALAD